MGAQRGFVRLYRYKSSNCGRHSVLTNYGYGSRLVPMTDLDTALENLGLADRPVLIAKMDVEGYEPEVVAGARQTLARADVVIIEYSPGLGRAGGLSPESMIDQLYAAGLFPYQLGANEWTKESPSSSRQFEGQTHLIWIRAGKEKSLWTGGAASSFLPTDKAALLRLAETWRHLAERGAKAGGRRKDFAAGRGTRDKGDHI